MSGQAVVCVSCGAKFKATRARCPRCRAIVATAPPQPAGTATASNGRTGAIVLAVFGIALAGMWLYSREPAPAARTPTGPIRDTLAARRPAAPAAASPQTASEAGMVPPDPAFLLSPELSANERRPDDVALLARSRLALERDPLDADALFDTGRLLLRLGRIEEALGPLRQAASMSADQWPQAFTLAYTCALGQHWPEAVAGFRRAKALRPSDPVTSYDLALAQQKMGDYAGAAQEYVAAGALAPSAAGLLGLAISLDRQGKAAEARAAYKDALRLMPEGPDAERVSARVRRLDGVSPQR